MCINICTYRCACTAFGIRSVISRISKLNRVFSSTRLSGHVLLEIGRLDGGWKIRLNDPPNVHLRRYKHIINMYIHEEEEIPDSLKTSIYNVGSTSSVMHI